MADLDRVREEHLAAGLERIDLDPDPVVQCRAWWDRAVEVGVHQPETVALATAGSDGRPTVRYVLLRGLAEDGLRFYTNYDSPKGQDLAANPQAALDLAWVEIGRQIRIEGPVHPTSAEDSDAYWASRPRSSQLAARASLQSRPVEDRTTMVEAVAAEAARWEGRDVPRPDNWGGYVLVPDRWEFWNGRPDRLHDRFVYEPDPQGGWTITRLWP
ncbi:MAG: pyridoxamine 5'-phosphate oxidase [Acidimicrobiales bacterium]